MCAAAAVQGYHPAPLAPQDVAHSAATTDSPFPAVRCAEASRAAVVPLGHARPSDHAALLRARNVPQNQQGGTQLLQTHVSFIHI